MSTSMAGISSRLGSPVMPSLTGLDCPASGGARSAMPERDVATGMTVGTTVGVAVASAIGVCLPQPTNPNVQPARARERNDLRFILHLQKSLKKDWIKKT